MLTCVSVCDVDTHRPVRAVQPQDLERIGGKNNVGIITHALRLEVTNPSPPNAHVARLHQMIAIDENVRQTAVKVIIGTRFVVGVK